MSAGRVQIDLETVYASIFRGHSHYFHALDICRARGESGG